MNLKFDLQLFGIDYLTCDCCGEAFPDVCDYLNCEKCDAVLCEGCCEQYGVEVYRNTEKDGCPVCNGDIVTDQQLLEFLIVKYCDGKYSNAEKLFRENRNK